MSSENPEWWSGTKALRKCLWITYAGNILFLYTNTTSRVENTIRGWSTQGRVWGGRGLKESLGGVVRCQGLQTQILFLKDQISSLHVSDHARRKRPFFVAPIIIIMGVTKAHLLCFFFNLESQWVFSVINTEQTDSCRVLDRQSEVIKSMMITHDTWLTIVIIDLMALL